MKTNASLDVARKAFVLSVVLMLWAITAHALETESLEEDQVLNLENQLANQVFRLKVCQCLLNSGQSHVSVAGTPAIEVTLYMQQDGSIVFGNTKYEKYRNFVRAQEMEIINVDVYDRSRGHIVLRLKPRGSNLLEYFVRIDSPSAKQENFSTLFNTLFFQPGENAESYTADVTSNLGKEFVEPLFPDASPEDKVAFLKFVSQTLDRPDFDKRGDSIYAREALFDSNSYNTLRLNKNQRLSTSVGLILKKAKEGLPSEGIPKLLGGFAFSWTMNSRNFAQKAESNKEEHVELFIPAQAFAQYLEGEASVPEILKTSIMKVDGEKYDLTNYEPQL
jgi:hypothetical protein